VLLWVYYSAQILLFGAEFTRVFAYRYGSRARQAALQNPEASGTTAQRIYRLRSSSLTSVPR
jgi:hypothetical protein